MMDTHTEPQVGTIVAVYDWPEVRTNVFGKMARARHRGKLVGYGHSPIHGRTVRVLTEQLQRWPTAPPGGFVPPVGTWGHLREFPASHLIPGDGKASARAAEAAAQEAREEARSKPCARCGELIPAARSRRARYCSKPCKDAASNARRQR